MSFIAPHYSYECLTLRHGDCAGACQFAINGCDARCSCACHDANAKAITREDVPQTDQFIDDPDNALD